MWSLYRSKLLKVLGAFGILFLLILIMNISEGNQVENPYEKSIYITINVGGEEVLKESEFVTESSTLSELMLEDNEGIEFTIESGDYGSYITAITVGDRIYDQYKESGYFWTYESENNKACSESEYCPASDDLTIEDNDKFTFNFDTYA